MTTFKPGTWLPAILAAAALAPCTAIAQQGYPSRPISFIATSSPGTIADLTMRIIAKALSDRLGWATVVENKISADWIIPAVHVVQSAPDGHTILGANSGMTVLPAANKKLPYDLMKDLAPITRVASTDTILVAHPSVPATNMKELIAYSKANPGKVTYGSTGISNPLALILEQFKIEGGLDALAIGYKNSGAFMPDVLSGRISMVTTSVGNVADLIRSGKLRPIVMMQPRRNASLPDVQSTADAGFPNSDGGFWFALMVQAKTPKPIIERLHREVLAVLKTPALQEQFLKIDEKAIWDDRPEDLSKQMELEIGNWAKIIRDAKLKLE